MSRISRFVFVVGMRGDLRKVFMEFLGKWVRVIMDRPLGSKHPEYELIYPINYGYIEGTMAGDGEEVDAYVIGEFQPLESFEGYVIAQISRSDDVEFKLVVSKNKGRYNKDQVEALVEFQERFYKSQIHMLE